MGDLHLSFSNNKPMDIFGRRWKNHVAKIEKNWKKKSRMFWKSWKRHVGLMHRPGRS